MKSVNLLYCSTHKQKAELLKDEYAVSDVACFYCIQSSIIFRTLEELNASAALATFIKIKGIVENRKTVETAFSGENVLILQ